MQDTVSLLSPFLQDKFDKENSEDLKRFADKVLAFRMAHGRHFPWQETFDPYRILVSEIMLQQTQTERVVAKYQAFTEHWPTLESLAKAGVDEVLPLWKGLGYNRRCLNLIKAAKMTEDFGYQIPDDPTFISSLPSVGPSTTAALLSFAFGHPSIYIETNVRTVLFTLFYPQTKKDEKVAENQLTYGKKATISDKELKSLLENILPFVTDTKQWYYALLDVGAQMKKELPPDTARSSHYHSQSPFKGSDRQLRGQVLQQIIDKGPQTAKQLLTCLAEKGWETTRISKALWTLLQDGLLCKDPGDRYGLPRKQDD
ncbi:MAG: DNA repair protein [Spirochaetia bacterium]|jgi:A/G-specific adenine glycosylase|nr:DNA repair protein [Spirochaetia bacterium]